MRSNGLKTYFATVGLLAHLLVIFCGVVLVKHWYSQGETLPESLRQSANQLQQHIPELQPVQTVLTSVATNLASPTYFWRDFDPRSWPTIGPDTQTSVANSLPAASLGTLWVSDARSLKKALKQVLPGQEIVLKKGTYDFHGKRLNISQVTPSASRPVTLRAEASGRVLLKMDSLEGIVINQPHWIISGLTFQGVCAKVSRCDHALHIVGQADHTRIENNTFIDFNAAIKVNRIQEQFPDHGLIRRNHFYNNTPRDTSRSVTPINLDHGNHWVIDRNIIRDFIKTGGNQVSYGAFMKGGGEGGVIENNLVICNTSSRQYGGFQVGLSLGGGGMGQNSRRELASAEGFRHTVRNNIVMHCNDVGLYINKASDVMVNNNIFYHTSGVDVRFPQSSAHLVNNVVSGQIRERDQGKATASNNLLLSREFFTDKQPLDRWFTSPAIGNFSPRDDASKAKLMSQATTYPIATHNEVTDFCGNRITPEDSFAGAFKDSQNCFVTRPGASARE
ncbi:chondroitinase-B domain-containing protein [Photobacterium sp. 1_MG-2023]|uniref:chondroitinase-B domain-containing protein n=1 Tax=Photobacterium sp. 1_MG-2023 TaxID=3062646 RepID=UPI0026E2D8FF|nr:chondroitinase-B domain-containing protein [Photobacterium sp. 1_MG-2023]MDO6705888.1 right-handed parallel beta-helix repeat-containing protein [Photobacterium sp. 1_MG-2023]